MVIWWRDGETEEVKRLLADSKLQRLFVDEESKGPMPFIMFNPTTLFPSATRFPTCPSVKSYKG